VDVVAAVGADEQSAAVVEPGEGALDDPALPAKAGSVLGLAPGDDWFDAELPDEAAVLVVVVAAVGDQDPRATAWPPDTATHGWHAIEQLEQLGDVVAVAAGERPGQRDAAAVYEQVVLAPCPAAIDGAGTCFRAPLAECAERRQGWWGSAGRVGSGGCCARVQP
jgi:hypothetical protein